MGVRGPLSVRCRFLPAATVIQEVTANAAQLALTLQRVAPRGDAG